jgi:ParB family transcriptional regulator, chromosome partitioning protein
VSSKFSQLSSRPAAPPTATGKGGNSAGAKNSLPKATSTRSMKDALFVRIEMVKPNKNQVRKYFDPEALEELTADVRQHGILEPLLVQELEPGEYQIIAGGRRYLAAKDAGLTELPVIVMQLSDKEARFIQLSENLQRQDLHPTDETEFFRTLQNEYNYSVTDLAKMVNKSRYYVQSRLDGKIPGKDAAASSNGTPSDSEENHDLLKKSGLNKNSQSVEGKGKGSKPAPKFRPVVFTRFNQSLDAALTFVSEQSPDAKTRQKMQESLEEMERKIAELKGKLYQR